MLVPVPVLRTCASAARWSLAPDRRLEFGQAVTRWSSGPRVWGLSVEKGSAPRLLLIIPLCELSVGWRVSESVPFASARTVWWSCAPRVENKYLGRWFCFWICRVEALQFQLSTSKSVKVLDDSQPGRPVQNRPPNFKQPSKMGENAEFLASLQGGEGGARKNEGCCLVIFHRRQHLSWSHPNIAAGHWPTKRLFLP
jgi:hypothetical protein